MKKTILATIISLAVLISFTGFAAEAEEAGSGEVVLDAGTNGHYAFSSKPEIKLEAGFRYINVDGSKKVEEFEYIENWPHFELEVRAVPYPHRLHLDVAIKNEKDYYADVTYAYKDLLLFRLLNSTLYHNLENIVLQNKTGDFPDEENYAEVGDRGEDYGIRVGITNALLRLKMPDYPAHLYFEGFFVDKSGTRQQRFVGGHAAFPSGQTQIRISEKRDIDYETSVYTIGANSHLGPVEIDYSHSEKRFDAGSNNVMINYYEGTPDAASGYKWTKGDYYHNLVPDLKSSTDTIRLHTMLTGKIVGSATLSWIDKENRDSGAEADYFFASGDLTWMPMTNLTFFLKYKHYDRDLDNQDPKYSSVPNLTGLPQPTPLITTLRKSISSTRNMISGTVRYRPCKGFVLKAGASYEDIDRDDEDAWQLPGSTERKVIWASGDVRLHKTFVLKLDYKHRDNDDPSVNTEPDRADEAKISATWTPFPRLNAYASYSYTAEKRSHLHFGNHTYTDGPPPDEEADDRDVKGLAFVGNLSYLISDQVSMNFTYSHMYRRIKQDIEYHFTTPRSGPPSLVDEGVPYKESINVYALDLNYMPNQNLTWQLGISHTVADGTFFPSEPDLLQPVSIAAFNRLKTAETVVSGSGEYHFGKGMAARMEYRYTNFDDQADSLYADYDDVSSGNAHIVLLMFKKHW